MPDGVVDQVGDQARDQARITGSRGRGQDGVDGDTPAVGFRLAVEQYLAGELSEVEGLPALYPALAAGQRQQRVDETFLLIAEISELLAGRTQVLGGSVGVGKRDLEQGPFSR